MKNYYAILEVPVGCSLEEIRQAYHRLAQEHLDDEASFTDLKEAYEVLTTPVRRDDYDRAAWGETFDTPSHSAISAAFETAAASRCPMGAESVCPVLLGRTTPADNFCPDCGYKLAALASAATFAPVERSSPARQVWLEERGGQTHVLRTGPNIVGRENADVLVPDKTVSRNHARLDLDESGGVSLEDLSSTNGTQVNEEQLTPHVPRPLADGDRVRFGSVSLLLHLAGAASEEPAPAVGAAPQEARAQVTEIGEGSGRVFPLAPGLTTFGRRAENSVVLTGDLYVSGRHAQISADGDVFILTDLGSTNGTLLNGERLQINTPVTLDAGDVIVIGGTALRFDRLGPGADGLDDLPEDAHEGIYESIHEDEGVHEDETGDTQTTAETQTTEALAVSAEGAAEHAEG